MIIIKVHGGLGNQMFQGALAMALAKHYKTEVLLDTTSFSDKPAHQGFELTKLFRFNVLIASSKQVKELLGWKQSTLGYNIVSRKSCAFLRGTNFYKERQIPTDKEVFSLRPPCYLDGNWQNEKYFLSVKSAVRNAYQFRSELAGENCATLALIKSKTAVSVHIRRGEYVSAESYHGLCAPDYYARAMRYIEKTVKTPFYLVFSDDIEWARNNLPTNHEQVFVSHNRGAASFNDMRLMASCAHHIVANSSFSWWAAWLNQSSEKIVIAPVPWYRDYHQRDVDPVPFGWIKQ